MVNTLQIRLLVCLDNACVCQQLDVKYDIEEQVNLLEWFSDHYREFGTTLEFVTDKSQEGSQFCKGFGGIGGVLRYKLDFASINIDKELAMDDELAEFM